MVVGGMFGIVIMAVKMRVAVVSSNSIVAATLRLAMRRPRYSGIFGIHGTIKGARNIHSGDIGPSHTTKNVCRQRTRLRQILKSIPTILIRLVFHLPAGLSILEGQSGDIMCKPTADGLGRLRNPAGIPAPAGLTTEQPPLLVSEPNFAVGLYRARVLRRDIVGRLWPLEILRSGLRLVVIAPLDLMFLTCLDLTRIAAAEDAHLHFLFVFLVRAWCRRERMWVDPTKLWLRWRLELLLLE